MKLLKIGEKVLPLVFWVFIIFAFDTPRFAILTIAAAAIHEAGHILFGNSRGIMRLFPAAHPTGFRIKPKRLGSYKDELILLLGGPVSNFTSSLLFGIIFALTGRAFFFDFAFLNLLTALANLLPIRGYDGYRIIEVLLLLRKKENLAPLSVLRAFSFAFTVLLTFLSLYLLLKIGEGYWIFALFFSSVLLDTKKLAEDNVF